MQKHSEGSALVYSYLEYQGEKGEAAKEIEKGTWEDSQAHVGP